MKILTLQITRDNFVQILKGEQKIETRAIFPTTANRYIQQNTVVEDGQEVNEVTIIDYDALLLINGRQKDAPRLTVEVVENNLVILQDEAGNDLIAIDKGIEFIASRMEYVLGEVLSHSNCDKILI